MSVGRIFQIEPLDATFGAVVPGLDVRELDAATFEKLYETWLEYALLVFPGQHLSHADQVGFARRFGELEFDLAPLSNVRGDGSLRAEDGDDESSGDDDVQQSSGPGGPGNGKGGRP